MSLLLARRKNWSIHNLILNSDDLRLYAKKRIDDKDKMIQQQFHQIQELKAETYKLKRMML